MLKEDKYELEKILMTPKVIKNLECQTYEEYLEERGLFSLKIAEKQPGHSYMKHCN